MQDEDGGTFPGRVAAQHSASLGSQTKHATEGNNQAAHVYVQKVKVHPSVSAVFGRIDADKTIHLWVVLSTDSYQDREAIYDQEAAMYLDFPGERFDFFIVSLPRLKKSLQQTMPPMFTELFSR